VQENGQTSENKNHHQAHPLHGINLAMAVIHPQNLSDGSNHGNDGSRVNISKLKGDEKKNDGEEVE
jgi:hypothetical protein